MTSTCTCLQRPSSEDSCDELWIPCRSERYRLRKTCAAFGHVPVKYFVMKNGWNAESRVFDQPFLNCVGEQCALAWTLLLPLPRNLSDTIFHYFRSLVRREVTAVRRKICLRVDLRSSSPKTRQLRNLFLERHSREQISHPTFDRKARILIGGTIFLCVFVSDFQAEY